MGDLTDTTCICRKCEREQFPHVARIGAYLFFGWSAFGSAVLAYIALRWCEFPVWFSTGGGNAAFIACFMALRDMTKRIDTRPPRTVADERG